jgi:nucleoid-associated protein YgaU
MISYNSRYTDSPLAVITTGGQDRTVIVATPQRNWTFSFASHQVSGNERLDTMAQRFYGDPSLWWQIADANPEIMDWTTLAAGQVLRIPAA